MRRWTIVVAVMLAGCGGGGGVEAEREQAPPPAAASTPEPTPVPAPAVAAEVRERLGAGEIGVVDFERRTLIAPARLRVNKEQVLSAVAWEGWGGPRATGRGEVETLVCDPSCAGGRVENAPGELTLTRPRVCGGERYYSDGRLKDSRGEAAVFLLTPC